MFFPSVAALNWHMAMNRLMNESGRVRSIRPGTAFIPCFLILCAAQALCQEHSSEPRKISCVVFTIQDLSADGAYRDYEQPLTASVSAAIEVNDLALVPQEKWTAAIERQKLDGRALLESDQALAVAREAGADFTVTGYFSVQEDMVYVSLQCWNVRTGLLAAGLQQTARFNIALYSVLHEHVVETIARIRAQEAPAQPPVALPPQPRIADITFLSADEGMEILLGEDASLGVIANGRLAWHSEGLIPGVKLRIQKRRPGFHTSWETVKATREIRLSRLEPEHRAALEMDWTFGQLLGLGSSLRLYFKPDGSFMFAGGYLFAQLPLTSAGSPVYHIDLSMGLGTYLIFPPDASVRFGISTGLGSDFTILTSAAGGAYTDVYLDVVNWWLETRVLGPVIFFRQEWKYTLGISSNLLGRQWMSVNGIPLMTLGVLFRW